MPLYSFVPAETSAPAIRISSPTLRLCASCVVTRAWLPVAVISVCIILGGLKLIATEFWIPFPDWYRKYFLVWRVMREFGEVPAVISTPPSKLKCRL